MASNEKKYSKLKHLLFLSILAGAFFLVLELILSLLIRDAVVVKSADENMIYSLYPNQKAVAFGSEYKVNIQTDSNGFRVCQKIVKNSAKELQDKKEKVIFILGDSFSEGWGVDCDKTFSGILSAKFLDSKSSKFNVRLYNGGVHGSSASYFVLRARYFLPRLKPDVLFVQFFDNDLDDLDKIERFISFDEDGNIAQANPPGLFLLPPGWLSRKIRERALYRFSRRAWKILSGQAAPIKYYKESRVPKRKILSHKQALKKFGQLRSIDDLDKKYNGQFSFYKFKTIKSIDENSIWHLRFQKMEKYIQQLIIESKSSNPNIKIVFLYIPAKEVFAKGGIANRKPENIRKSLYELRINNPFFQLLDSIAKKNSIKLIDGQKILYNNPENLYFPGDAHLNSAGHTVVAKEMLKIIIE